jgi:hypothetical protein
MAYRSFSAGEDEKQVLKPRQLAVAAEKGSG